MPERKRPRKRARTIAHSKGVDPRLTYFLAIIAALLAACQPAGDVFTPTAAPAATGIPTEIVSSMEPPSMIPSPVDPPVTKTVENRSVAITPSAELTFLPDEIVITLRQEGGFAGLDHVWILYQDGRIEMNGELSGQLSAKELALLLDSIEQSGFFEFDHPESGSFCCDFFTFSITATVGDKSHSISVSDGDPGIPAGVNEIISLLLQSFAP